MSREREDPAELRDPEDVCSCGDARKSHQRGTGRCNLGELCTPGRCQRFRLFRRANESTSDLVPVAIESAAAESQEKRARRLFDEMARNIGREAVNHLKTMYPQMLSDKAGSSKIWELSLTNHIRNDINWRMRPLLMAMIAMHREWEEESAG